ncbi:energy-coupling factor transporter transmembrane protein EcfT [Promethearchaeum syntrophicum]|uniref:Energy-coupling factor transporter transmembrane protein EcfT n=1 Tax=Promethearchaeum syntrophicum TaxID=2594042 RepID=A0A5B9DFD1_9ARCH|nr:energy-coupling factor transporter transmembrane component T [Candidatus Prometheoarchaeum syntrophicum]QEE17500.1 Energy-coupling factor transporter transmembrane protein EcfT [Candidatus Prometheoarchaeum syntrophicum]
MKKEYRYKYGIHPAIKLTILIIFNISTFHPLFYDYRWGFLIFEILLAVMIRLNFQKLKGYIKFLVINFLGFYFLFYFIDFSWIQALLHLFDYFLTISIISLQTFIFYSTTPPFELIIGLKTLKVPGHIAFAISIAISFLPIISNEISEVLVMQQSRGYKFRLINLKPIIIPTILGVIDYSTNLAMSLEARGFKI